MKKAIQFGAGNIGRGFIGAVLSEAGYHVVFADVNELVVNKINEDGKYTVAIMDTECTEQVITNISAVDSRSPELAKEIAQAQGVTEYLNVIACENGLRASSQLKEHVYSHLTDEQKAYADEYVAFPDCSVDRIVPPIKSENPIDVVVEKFYEWNVERASIKGDLQMEGMNLADNLIAYIERKLFTLNTGHAITAYLGNLKGLKTIADSIADEEIYTIVKAAMQESGEGLVAKYGFDHDAHFAYIDKIIGRFRNPHLQDDVTRVGREPLRKLSANDRLIKPTMTAIEHGFATPNLVRGIGAALHYNNPEDPQSVQLQQAIAEVGVAKAFEQFSGVSADSELAAQVLAAYDSWM